MQAIVVALTILQQQWRWSGWPGGAALLKKCLVIAWIPDSVSDFGGAFPFIVSVSRWQT